MLGYAGAPMPPEQMRQAYERLTPHLVQYYGLVEAIPPVTVLDAADHARGLAGEPDLLTQRGRARRSGSSSRWSTTPVADLPAGEVGEVVTRGDHVMAGLLERRAAAPTCPRPCVDGWLHTGDLGRLGADGHLWLVDRKGDMIISGGYNIYPREVEDVVAEVPGVAEVAVLGLADPDWGQRVVAVYSRSPVRRSTAEQVHGALPGRARVVQEAEGGACACEAFPLSSTGKIAKKVLREQLEARDG